MVEVLSNSKNPKHRNSEFLKFLKQLNSGAIIIKDEKLIVNDQKMKVFESEDVLRIEKDLER